MKWFFTPVSAQAPSERCIKGNGTVSTLLDGTCWINTMLVMLGYAVAKVYKGL